MGAVTTQRHTRGINCLHCAHGITFYTGNLHQAANRVTGQSKIMLHGDLGGIFDLLGRAASHLGQGPGRHRTGRTDFTLTTHFSA